jgi:hypothetical protein
VSARRCIPAGERNPSCFALCGRGRIRLGKKGNVGLEHPDEDWTDCVATSVRQVSAGKSNPQFVKELTEFAVRLLRCLLPRLPILDQARAAQCPYEFGGR